MTLSASARSLALFGAASALVLLLDQPAQAHGIAHGGIASGFLHPLLGTDHLLLLIGVGLPPPTSLASCCSGPWPAPSVVASSGQWAVPCRPLR
ncbi:HupE/UreJ family protein [Synechococcus sp. Lug-A]|uniref:HupE/UreJ family protein n=1 Tax=Synechococcus sp. Lug-A TaxID=2823740 RepID=UPI0020CD4BD3|nr:HupE/UreJ family protein [Synechococcus sp. Lug-A]